MSLTLLLSFRVVSLLAGCDHSGESFIPTPNADYPYIQDLGEFRVIPADEASDKDWTADSDAARADDDEGRHGVYYGGLGAPENLAYFGGATFQFEGTGSTVCLVMDPEAVYWSQARAPDATSSDYLYQDLYEDDGDIDMSAGLTAYYTGSPGVEMGDFEAQYTDPAGVDHQLAFNDCFQAGYNSDSVHSGRATVESCNINTSGMEGISYTAVLDTFMLPVDDSVVHFAVGVFEGGCDNYAVDECLLPREYSGAQDEDQDVDCDDPDAAFTYTCLEEKYCKNTKKNLNEYCEWHFDDEGTACIDNGVHPPKDEEEEGGGAAGP